MLIYPDWLPMDAWKGYLDMRKQRRIPTTPRAERMLLKQLADFRDEGYDLEYLIDEANVGGWKKFYASKDTPRLTKPRERPEPDWDFMRKVRERLEEAKKRGVDVDTLRN